MISPDKIVEDLARVQESGIFIVDDVAFIQGKHGLAIGLYFGYAQGGQVIKSIYPTNANGALGFTELNYRF